MITTFKKFIQSINEGLITTYPIDITIKTIKTEFNGFNILIKDNANTFDIEICDVNSLTISELNTYLNKINTHIINRCGWFPSKMLIDTGKMKKEYHYDTEDIFKFYAISNSITITFEANFDDYITDVPDTLYHLSIMEYKNKILKHGLIPKSKSKKSYHTDRIYLCKSKSDCVKLISQMNQHYSYVKFSNNFNSYNSNYEKDTTPIIFKIDNSSKVIKKLYNEPNFDNGYYVLDNIPPTIISI